MSCAVHCEMGWVEAATMASPCLRASPETMERRRVMSRRASWMLRQMPVPTSICAWIISGLTCSPSNIRPSSSISATRERSSRVCGSTIWNSSSIPSVYRASVIGKFSCCLLIPERRLDVRAVLVREPLEGHAHAAAGVAVDDLAVADQVAPGERQAQREQRALGDFGLRVHVEAARADVLRAGDARQVGAVVEHVDDEPRALVLPALLMRLLAVDEVHRW